MIVDQILFNDVVSVDHGLAEHVDSEYGGVMIVREIFHFIGVIVFERYDFVGVRVV